MIASVQRTERLIVRILFSLFFLHLLLYVWLVPPWQHYDEPTHLEYALLIRDLGRLPTMDEQIPDLRRAIARSMIDVGFFRNQQLPLTAPDPNAPDLALGINERGHPPVYYVLVALGTLPVRGLPIELQLRVARCVSVGLALLLFLAAYWLLRLVTAEAWGLRCAVLAALALQPAFVDNCSAVNNDVLANLVAVLVLIVSVKVAVGGWRLVAWGTQQRRAAQQPVTLPATTNNHVIVSARRRVIVATILVVAFAWNVKRTLLAYSLLVPLAWLVSAPRLLQRAVFGMIAVAGLAAGLWLTLAPWPLADWQGSDTALVAQPTDAFGGGAAFRVRSGEVLTQRIYPYRVLAVGTQPLTLTVQMRAEQPMLATSAVLKIGTRAYSQPVALDTTWQLVTVTAELRDLRQPVAIELPGGPSGSVISYDAVALVASPGPIPREGEPDGAYEAGALGGTLPRNMARNAGAERRIPPLPTALVGLIERRIGQQELAQLRSSSSNPGWIMAVYPRQFWLLFIGSWGIFGWGQYAVSAGWFTPLALLAAASVFGTCILLLRQLAEGWQRRAWWMCALAVVLGWGVALLRVHNQPFPGAMFWSFGRYTFVAIVPSLLFFVAGFRALFPPSLRNQATAAQIGFLALFALVAILGFGNV